MALTDLRRKESVANVLKRLREKAELTTRQAAGIIGVTHTTISQYENGKRDFTGLRIEQLVRAYGYNMEEFEKILGHRSVDSDRDDCVTLIGQLDHEQVAAVRAILFQLRHKFQSHNVTDPTSACSDSASIDA